MALQPQHSFNNHAWEGYIVYRMLWLHALGG